MLGVAKREISRAIADLSDRARFAIVYGHEMRTMVFPTDGRPLRATPGNKTRSQVFLSRAPVAGSTRIEYALRRAIDVAARLTSRRKVIVYVGPGDPYDADQGEILASITAANGGRSQINTIGVAPYDYNERFLQQLAARNRGTYKRVN